MRRLGMSVIRPSRRKDAGYVARWTDPLSGKRRQKLLDCRRKREAYEAAAKLADQVEAGEVLGGLPWLEFCQRYERQHLERRSGKSIQAWHTVKWFVEEQCPLKSIANASDIWVDRFLDAVSEHCTSPNTEATYIARLKAALRWAHKKRYLRQLPYLTAEWERQPRSDAVTASQFQAMLDIIPTVRKRDGHLWRRLLRGQFYTGLRIGELLALSWDADADIRVVVGDRPHIHFAKQKNKKRQKRPLVPEAWEIIADTPIRTGPVFPIPGKAGQITTTAAIRVVAKIGAKAGVVTNKQTGKTATSHDIRRAFFDWAERRYDQRIASLLMRHADQQTTDDFYNTQESEKLAELLWDTQE